MEAPVQIGQFILAKNLGIGAFGKVRVPTLLVCWPRLTRVIFDQNRLDVSGDCISVTSCIGIFMAIFFDDTTRADMFGGFLMR
jgi:hypothetical protein